VLVYTTMVIAATAYSWCKLDSLSFHTRDYPFYVEFCARLGDPGMTQGYSLNPEGTNILRYGGVEGARIDVGLHQAVHFEPVKYTWATLYHLIGMRALLSIMTAIYFLPVLYMLAIAPIPRGRAFSFHVLFALCYSLYPSVLAATSHDLRPFALLLPFFSLALFSLLFKRRRWEVLLLFNLLFAAREEALVLGLGIVLIAFVMRGRSRTSDSSVLPPWALLLNWGAWVVVTVAYYQWTGYETTLPADLLRYIAKLGVFPASLVAIAVLAGAAAVVLLAWRRTAHYGRVVLALLALSCMALLPALRDLRGEPPGVVALEVLYNPWYSIAPRIALLSLVPLWLSANSPTRQKQVVWGQAALALAFVLFSALPFPDAAASRIKLFRERRPNATNILALGRSVDPYETTILCDMDTYQAFCHVDKARVYERWPYWIVPGEARFFPENASHVQRVVDEEANYVAMSTRSADVLIPLLSRSSARFDTLSVSDLFLVLEVKREQSTPSPTTSP